MYAQKRMMAKGLKERRTRLSFLLLLIIAIIHILSGIQLFTYNSVDIQACYLAKKG